MADLYLGKIDISKLESLKDKAYEGRLLDVAIWVDPDKAGTDEDWKEISISHGNKKKGEEVTYVGNAKKFKKDDGLGF